MAKASVWTKLLGEDAARTFNIFRVLDEMHLDTGAIHRLLSLVRAAPAAASPARSSESGTLVTRFETTPTFVMELVPSVRPSDPGPDLENPLITVIAGPASGAAGDSNRMIGLLFDMPWQLAFGLTPISADSGSLANNEPRGWLEASLAVSALASPFYLETSADLNGGDIVGLVEALGPVRGAVSLSGDFSAGVTLAAPSFEVDWLALSAGNDFNLILGDNFVAAGATLVVDAGTLGAGQHILFDGSGETNGRFHFIGSAGDDIVFGGGGADRIEGGRGRDSLSGGGGSDVFIYRSAADSSGRGYDTIADFNPAADRIDLPGAVGGFAAAITSGTLSAASFDADLAAAVGNLGASRAVWFAPNAGDLAGQLFLIADGNGQAGYQAGGDFVIAVIGSPLATLAATPDIFI